MYRHNLFIFNVMTWRLAPKWTFFQEANLCRGLYLSGTSRSQIFVRDEKITIIYQGRGSSHRLCLPHVPPPCEQTNQAARPRGTIQLVLVFVFFLFYFLSFCFHPPCIIVYKYTTCRLCATLWRLNVSSSPKLSLLLSSAWTVDSWWFFSLPNLNFSKTLNITLNIKKSTGGIQTFNSDNLHQVCGEH